MRLDRLFPSLIDLYKFLYLFNTATLHSILAVQFCNEKYHREVCLLIPSKESVTHASGEIKFFGFSYYLYIFLGVPFSLSVLLFLKIKCKLGPVLLKILTSTHKSWHMCTAISLPLSSMSL